MINIVFIIMYLVLFKVVSAKAMLYMFVFNNVFNVLNKINSKSRIIDVDTFFYITNVLFALSNINLINVAGTAENTTYDYIIINNIDLAVQIFCIGTMLIAVGIEIALGNVSLPKIGIELNDKQIKYIFIILLFVSNDLTLNLLPLAQFGSVVKILPLSALFGIIYYMRIGIEHGNQIYIRSGFILYIIATFNGLFFGFLRVTIVMPTIVLFVAILIANRDYRWLLSYKIIPFVFAFVIFSVSFSDLGKYRGLQSNYRIISDVISRKLSDDSKSQVYYADEHEKSASLVQRTSTIAPLTEVIKLVDQNGFYHGAASAPLVLALIPRFLYPDKPIIALGRWFALEAGLAYKDEQNVINNSVQMSIPGEFYLDFGWTGIFFGCILFGIFFGAIWNSTGFFESSNNFTGTIFGGYLISLIFYGIGADLQIVFSFLSLYLVLYAIKIIFNRYS